MPTNLIRPDWEWRNVLYELKCPINCPWDHYTVNEHWDFNSTPITGGTFYHNHPFRGKLQNTRLYLNVINTLTGDPDYDFPIDWVDGEFEGCPGLFLPGSTGTNRAVELVSEKPMIQFNKPWTFALSGRLLSIGGQFGGTITFGHGSGDGGEIWEMKIFFDNASADTPSCVDGFNTWGDTDTVCQEIRIPGIRFPSPDDLALTIGCYYLIISVDPCEHKMTISAKVSHPTNVRNSTDDTPGFPDPNDPAFYTAWVQDNGAPFSTNMIPRERICYEITPSNVWKTFNEDSLEQSTGPDPAKYCNPPTYTIWNSNGDDIGWFPSLYNCESAGVRCSTLKRPNYFYIRPNSGANFVLDQIKIKNEYLDCFDQNNNFIIFPSPGFDSGFNSGF